MNKEVKPKEPWLGVLLNLIFSGLGQLYAKRTTRALVIIGVNILLMCLGLFGLYIFANTNFAFTKSFLTKVVVGSIVFDILENPNFTITKSFLTIGIVFVVFASLFRLFVLIDGFLCVRNYNISAGVKPTKATIRLLSIIGCVIWLFLPTVIRPHYIISIKAFKIPTTTMQPTIKAGDRILVNKKAFDNATPQRWDIVAFHNPQDRKPFVRRIAGLSGETLEIKDGKVIINGKEIESKFHYYNKGEYGKEGQKIEIPQDNYYVLGDNSANSLDSRYFGFVPMKDIIGKATKIYWPLDRSGKIE